jgi:hypothetical protein
MARVILFLGLLGGLVRAYGAESDAMVRIRAQLAAHPSVRAEFVQTKRMADMQHPLVARGRMLVWGQAGVLWQIEQPISSVIVLREDVSIQIDAAGRRTMRRAEDDPAAARVGRVLSALLHGDIASLQQWFDVDARMAGGRWTIKLTPRKGPMASFLQSMQVSGATFAEAVAIEETSGDATEIRFSNQRDGSALSEEERSLLSQ